MQTALIIDIILVVLVSAGIFFAWRLQRALGHLQQNRAAMEGFIGTFVQSIARAEKAIAELHGTARTLSSDIDEKMKKAAAMRDELTFLVDAADKVATRLTDNTSQAQGAARAAKEKEKEKMPKVVPPITEPILVEKLVQAVPSEKHMAAPAEEQQAPMPAWAKRLDNDTNVINKLPNPSAFAAAPVAAPKPQAVNEKTADKATQPRSQAERELMQALEKMR